MRAVYFEVLFDGFIKRTLQLEEVTSLKIAIERAKAVKGIQEENFEKGRKNFNGRRFDFKNKDHQQNFYNKNGKNEGSNGRGKNVSREEGKNVSRKTFSKECWQFGKTGVSRKQGKHGLVELVGESSTHKIETPDVDKNVFKINRISEENENFCFKGTVDGKSCSFKIDTGSDISILNKRFIQRGRENYFLSKIVI